MLTVAAMPKDLASYKGYAFNLGVCLSKDKRDERVHGMCRS